MRPEAEPIYRSNRSRVKSRRRMDVPAFKCETIIISSSSISKTFYNALRAARTPMPLRMASPKKIITMPTASQNSGTSPS